MGAVTRLRRVVRVVLVGWDSTIARHEQLTTSPDLLECTPRAAMWCRIHGRCCCNFRPAFLWDCQLHSPISSHGIEHAGLRP